MASTVTSPRTGRVSSDDAVLALIPASLLVALFGAAALPVSLGTALAVGSIPATGTVGYALFYDPPVAGE